jgi:hypothetical protein
MEALKASTMRHEARSSLYSNPFVIGKFKILNSSHRADASLAGVKYVAGMKTRRRVALDPLDGVRYIRKYSFSGK